MLQEERAQHRHSELQCATFSSFRDSGDGCCYSIFSLPQLSWKSLSLTGLLLERTELYLKSNFGANGNRSVRVVIMRFFWNFLPVSGEGGEIKTFCISLFSKWDGSCCHQLQLPWAPRRLPAGGLHKIPKNGACQPHPFHSLSFSLSEIKIKQIPDGATYSTGQEGTLLRFL